MFKKIFPVPESSSVQLPRAAVSAVQPTINIAKVAGRTILDFYEAELTVTAKADDTPLTEADLAANQVIIEQLQLLTPDIPILTEESCGVPFEERHGWETYWLVDPLDGTREFIKHSGEFSVNIALIHHGEPVLGVVHAPVLDVTYWAHKGGGAWKQDGDNQPQPIEVRPVPDNGVTVARSRAPLNGGLLHRFLNRLGSYRVVSMGSALKSCLVAEGRADLYVKLGPTCEWDTGAAQCIVEQAGGHVTDTRMQELRYNTRESLLNPHFFVFGKGGTDWSEFLDHEVNDT
ncbi:MAG: 3'(2'),5'-bisphosphate nucleotidase CysQ [Pseudomonadota bacterium]